MQAAEARHQDAPTALTETQPPLPLRNDTILGVCEALGQDFGFSPNYLRVVLASLVLWNTFAAIGIYLALGLVIALSRWAYPRPAGASLPLAQPASPVVADNANAESLPLAA